MNSSEQREFESVTPTENEIMETADFLKHQLELPHMNLADHAAFKDGYEEAVTLLTGNKNAYDQISPSLANDVSRAIAVLAINYVNGECSKETFLALLPDE